MRIEHVAIWTGDLERLKRFYTKYFNCIAGNKHRNKSNNFESYFLSFDNSARLELMQMPAIPNNLNDPKIQYEGIIHIAISVGSKENINVKGTVLLTIKYDSGSVASFLIK